VLDEVVEIENAFSLLAAALSDGEQARQPPPSGAVLRIGENVWGAIREAEPRADGKP
jgi:hypothetical protein